VVKLSGDHKNEATWVICRNIKAGRQKDFDDWFEHYLTFERKASGYLGTTFPEVVNHLCGILYTVLLIKPERRRGKIHRNQ
jgi:antibiotic biosynthesis monooxygenase (ABM) superfamily enzyme